MGGGGKVIVSHGKGKLYCCATSWLFCKRYIVHPSTYLCVVSMYLELGMHG